MQLHMVAMIAGLCVLDQAVKFWARTVLQPVGRMELIPRIISLSYEQNSGAFFSILEGKQLILISVTIVAVTLIITMLTHPKYRFRGIAHWALMLILTGALGNFTDRLCHGYVIDMFKFEFMTFAIFNVADICITIGGIVFVAALTFGKTNRGMFEKKNAAA